MGLTVASTYNYCVHQGIVLVVTSAVSRIAKGVVRLAWPVLVAQLAVIASGVLDTVMAGRYSAVDLAAVGIGASVYFSVFIGLMGVVQALSPIAAQLF